MLTLFGLLALGCAGAPSAHEATAPGGEPIVAQAASSPDQAASMRRPGYCCTELPMQDLVSAYLEMGKALAHGEVQRVEPLRLAMAEQLDHIRPNPELEIIRGAITDLSGCDLLTCREHFATLSNALTRSVQRVSAGDLDIAIAYSRSAQAHWLQSGSEILSPYGDSREACEWGTRQQVRAADAVRGGAPPAYGGNPEAQRRSEHGERGQGPWSSSRTK